MNAPGPAPAFRWPPRETNDAPIPAAAPPSASPARPRSSFLDTLVRIEQFWLLPTAVSFAEAAQAKNWAPDDPCAYCDLCGSSVGPHEMNEFGCAECYGRHLPWARFVRLGSYHGALADFVKEAKFHRRRTLARDLGRALGSAVRRAGVDRRRLCVIPVPIAWLHRVTRSFDHAGEIAHGAAMALDAPLVRALSARRRPSQRSVPASRRRDNVRGSFRPRRGVDLAGWTVLLIDDVRTTGSTLIEASRSLRRQGARDLWIGVLAVTPSPGRRSASPPRRGVVGIESTRLDTHETVGTVPLSADGNICRPGGVSVAPDRPL